MQMESGHQSVFREQYEALFGRQWPFVTAALLVAVTNVFLFAFERLGTAVFLPNVTGWASALLLVLAVLAAWYLFAAWNEKSGKLSLT